MKFYLISEVAHLLRVHKTTVRRWINQEKRLLANHLSDHTIVVEEAEIKRFLKRNEIGGTK